MAHTKKKINTTGLNTASPRWTRNLSSPLMIGIGKIGAKILYSAEIFSTEGYNTHPVI
jgi:hypothetical protein